MTASSPGSRHYKSCSHQWPLCCTETIRLERAAGATIPGQGSDRGLQEPVKCIPGLEYFKRSKKFQAVFLGRMLTELWGGFSETGQPH